MQLSQDMVEKVAARTEGWLVGLQLLGLSLQGQTDPGDLLEEVNGNQRYIFDYLIEEVFGRQNVAVQTFLLRTSILERLSAPYVTRSWNRAGASRCSSSWNVPIYLFCRWIRSAAGIAITHSLLKRYVIAWSKRSPQSCLSCITEPASGMPSTVT